MTDYSEQESQGLVLVAEAEDLKIVDTTTYEQAGEMLKAVKAYLAEVHRVTAPVVQATHAAWKAALGQRQGLEAHALEAERILKRGLGAYEQAQRDIADAIKRENERIRREAEARVKEEAKATGVPVEAVVVFTPPPPPPLPKLKGVSFTDTWTFEITNPAEVPREYLMVDEKKVGAVVRALKNETKIPGIKAIPGRGVRA